MKIYSFEDDRLIKHEGLIEALNIDLKNFKVITAVGAGGKTSTLFDLAKEISSLNKKVVLTTTTHMRLEEDFILVDSEADLYKINEKLDKVNFVKVAKKESDYKVKSMDFDILKQILEIPDFVLIEGDGSRTLPLKIPKEKEPVILEETDLVLGIMGFDSIGEPIEKICHRKELVAEFLKKDLNEKIEIEDLVKIASSKRGLKKDVICKYKVIVNKVDREEDLKICKKIYESLKKENIDVIFTSRKY